MTMISQVGGNSLDQTHHDIHMYPVGTGFDNILDLQGVCLKPRLFDPVQCFTRTTSNAIKAGLSEKH